MKDIIKKHAASLVVMVALGLIALGGVDVQAEPQEQEEFVETVESFYKPYDAAPNELKKSSLRVKRRSALSKILPNREISEWVGTLKVMKTNSEGKAYITIKLEGSRSIEVKTWNNMLSDISDNTLIPNGSRLYTQIAELEEGATVMFSGRFLSSKEDFLREASLTERGSMTAPEFIMKFSDVEEY